MGSGVLLFSMSQWSFGETPKFRCEQGSKQVETEPIVRKFETRQRALSNLTADFTQTNVFAASPSTTSDKGRFHLKRPNRLYWEYEGKSKAKYVADGTYLWDIQLEQVTKYDFEKYFDPSYPLSILLGTTHLQRIFDVKLVCRDASKFILYAVPHAKRTDISELQFLLATNYDLVGVSWKESISDKITKFDFHNLNTDTILDSLFVVNPPRGTDFIDRTEN